MQKIDLNGKTILVTGSPGFIGANLVMRLLKELASGTVVSLDNMNDYYDPKLKEYRLGLVEKAAEKSPVKHVFIKGSIGDKELVDKLFADYHFDIVVNLAAQAGVRYSIDHPDVYIESNIIGFYNLLEACRHNPVEHLVYASSSSVYGGNKKVPFSTEDKVDNPVSLYAATKKSDELLAHAYSKLYNIPSTGLRFFTVYGPAGRPDMFYYSATQKLVAGKTIQIFNYGDMRRDFTYIDGIVEGIVRVSLISEHHLPTITQARWERHRDKFIKTIREIAERKAAEEESEDHIEGDYTPVVGQNDVGNIPVEPAFLLVYAAAGNGQIMKIQTLGSPTQVSASGKEFMADMSQRESARWVEALDLLITWGWVKAVGHKGQIYELTGTGYKKADWLKEGMRINTDNEPLEELKRFEQ